MGLVNTNLCITVVSSNVLLYVQLHQDFIQMHHSPGDVICYSVKLMNNN